MPIYKIVVLTVFAAVEICRGEILEMRGILFDSRTIQFSLNLLDGHAPFWIGLGESQNGVKVLGYDANTGTLTVNYKGEERKLELSKSVIRELATADNPVEIAVEAVTGSFNPRLQSEPGVGSSAVVPVPHTRSNTDARSEHRKRRREIEARITNAAPFSGELGATGEGASKEAQERTRRNVENPRL